MTPERVANIIECRNPLYKFYDFNGLFYRIHLFFCMERHHIVVLTDLLFICPIGSPWMEGDNKIHHHTLGLNTLKTTLKAEINPDAWATLNSDISRSFEKPKQGRIAVKVINHLGDEVMKVFRI